MAGDTIRAQGRFLKPLADTTLATNKNAALGTRLFRVVILF